MVTLSLNDVVTAHVNNVFGEGSSFLGKSRNPVMKVYLVAILLV